MYALDLHDVIVLDTGVPLSALPRPQPFISPRVCPVTLTVFSAAEKYFTVVPA